MTKRRTLCEAITEQVRAGMFLNFASTPSRSNAAIIGLCKVFADRKPQFVLGATGFHSLGHLPALLGLGRRYVACFFGDNYPTPRPNPIYDRLLKNGVALEHWSLLSYVEALRAGACGHDYGVTRSLSGTDLGRDLTAQGQYRELQSPDGSVMGLVRAMLPDVTFLHAPLAAEDGTALFYPPHGEGFLGAMAAQEGVILTADRIVSREELLDSAQLIAFPRERVLAVCETPFGAHPQPLRFPPAHFPESCGEPIEYRDDEEHYRLWAKAGCEPEFLADFRSRVLNQEDPWQAYLNFVGQSRLQALRHARGSVRREASSDGDTTFQLRPSERTVVLAARKIRQRVISENYTAILAGIGQAFAAARLAAVLLERDGVQVELLVETGFGGLNPMNANPFLLSHQNINGSTRFGSVDTFLGQTVCGRHNRCIGVFGSAEVDELGQVNSSYSQGRMLVGSGGANDIASAAAEVFVISRAAKGRLVDRVQYVTSSGERVRCVVTEDGILEREHGWKLDTLDLAGTDPENLRRHCPWPLTHTSGAGAARAESQPSVQERTVIERMRAETRAASDSAPEASAA